MIRYFISDLHLSDKRPDLIRAFVLMMSELTQKHTFQGGAELYLLGDFYEAWIGDDYQPEWNQPIEHSLRLLIDSGTPAYFIHGNRDFLLGKEWCQRVGATLLDEQTPIQEYEQTVLLTHGDEYCKDDVEYQKFRAMVRTPEWQHHVLSMPLKQRIALAEQLRNDSKTMSADKSMTIMDVTEDSVFESMQKANAKTLIHGHTHRPEFHIYERYQRCVLGDWDKKVWLATLEKGQLIQSYSLVKDFLENGLASLKEVHSATLL